MILFSYIALARLNYASGGYISFIRLLPSLFAIQEQHNHSSASTMAHELLIA